MGYGKPLVISLDLQALITCCPLCILSSTAERVISCMCGTLHIKHPLTFLKKRRVVIPVAGNWLSTLSTIMERALRNTLDVDLNLTLNEEPLFLLFCNFLLFSHLNLT